VIAFNKLHELQENKEIEDNKLGSTDLISPLAARSYTNNALTYHKLSQ